MIVIDLFQLPFKRKSNTPQLQPFTLNVEQCRVTILLAIKCKCALYNCTSGPKTSTAYVIILI